MSFSQDKSEFLLHFFHFQRGSLTREDFRPVLERLQQSYPSYISRGQTWEGSLWALLGQRDLETISESWNEPTFAEILLQAFRSLFGAPTSRVESAPASDLFATGLGQVGVGSSVGNSPASDFFATGLGHDVERSSQVPEAYQPPHSLVNPPQPYGSDVFGTSLGPVEVPDIMEKSASGAEIISRGRGLPEQNKVASSTISQGRYAFVRRLAQGGMGEVWEGFDRVEQWTVAIKSVLYQQDAGLLARFRSEVRVLRQLQHPNIVRILDDCLDQSPPFFVMELLQGDDLSTFMDRRLDQGLGGYPLRQTLAIMLQLSGALNHIHEKGLVHRDIKPQNIFLCDGGQTVKLLDFGIVRDIEATRHTQFGGVVGTPYFMAPEQITKGSRDTDIGPLADVYACGILMYYLPTGTVPMSGSEPLADIFERLLQENQIALDECPIDLQDSYRQQAHSFAELQKQAVTHALNARCSMKDLQAGLYLIARRLADARKLQISRRQEKFERLVQDGKFEEATELAKDTTASYPEARQFVERFQKFSEDQLRNNEKIRQVEKQFDLLPLEKIQQIWEQAQAGCEEKDVPFFLHHPFQQKLKQVLSHAGSLFASVKSKARLDGPKEALAMLENQRIYSEEWNRLQNILQHEVSLFEYCKDIPVDFRKSEPLRQSWLESIGRSELSTSFFQKEKEAWEKRLQEQETQVQKDNEERCQQSLEQFVRRRSLFVGWSWLGVGGFVGGAFSLFYAAWGFSRGSGNAASIVLWVIGCVLFFLLGLLGVPTAGELSSDDSSKITEPEFRPSSRASHQMLVAGLGCISLWSLFFFVYCVVAQNISEPSFLRLMMVSSFALMGFTWRPSVNSSAYDPYGTAFPKYRAKDPAPPKEGNKVVAPLVFIGFILVFLFALPSTYSKASGLSIFTFFTLLGISIGAFIHFTFSEKGSPNNYVMGYGLLSFALGAMFVFILGEQLDVLLGLYIRNTIPFEALFVAFGFGAFVLSLLLWQKNFSASVFFQDFFDDLREEKDPDARLVEGPQMKRMAFLISPLLGLAGLAATFLASQGLFARNTSVQATTPAPTPTASRPPQEKHAHQGATSPPPAQISCSIPKGDPDYPRIATPLKIEVGDLGVYLSFRDEKGRESSLTTYVHSEIPFGRKSRFVYAAVLEWRGCGPAEMILHRMQLAESGKKCVPYRHCNRHIKKIIPLGGKETTSIKTTNRRIRPKLRASSPQGHVGNRNSAPSPLLPSTPTQRALEDFEKVYTLILYGSRTMQETLSQQSLFRKRGLGTTVIDSRFFSGLNPGWFILVYGTYRGKKDALSGKKKVEGMGFKGVYYKYTGHYLMRSRLCVAQSGNIVLWRDKDFRERTGHFLAARQCVQRLQTDRSKAFRVRRTFWARTSAGQKIRLRKSISLSPEGRGIFLYQSQSPTRVRLNKRQRRRYLQQIGPVYLVRTAQGRTGWVAYKRFH